MSAESVKRKRESDEEDFVQEINKKATRRENFPGLLSEEVNEEPICQIFIASISLIETCTLTSKFWLEVDEDWYKIVLKVRAQFPGFNWQS